MTTPECCTPSEGKKCCPCRKLPGLFLILFGLTFLLRELGVISPHVAAVTWPVIVILAGAQYLFRDLCKCCKTESN
jgi:fatty acid desaturase